MSTRDYVAEMRALLDAETADAPYQSRVVASRVVAKLRATDPDLLDGWLDAQAEHFVWQAINDRDRSRRSATLHHARRIAFWAAAEQHADGESAALTNFLDMPFPVGGGDRKRLADLTATDLRFVASEYERRASENAMTAAFLRALAKKVGKATVADRFTEEQLARLWLTQQHD